MLAKQSKRNEANARVGKKGLMGEIFGGLA